MMTENLIILVLLLVLAAMASTLLWANSKIRELDGIIKMLLETLNGKNKHPKKDKTILKSNKPEEVKSFKEMLGDSPEFKAYMEKKIKERDDFVSATLEKHLKEEDKDKFKKYSELAEYFAGGERVVSLQHLGDYETTRFGVKIYGVEYWMDEKETVDLYE